MGAEKSYPTSKVRGGSPEELAHFQGKEQRLHLAGAAMRRYPTSKVRETPVRGWALRGASEGRQMETTITDNRPI